MYSTDQMSYITYQDISSISEKMLKDTLWRRFYSKWLCTPAMRAFIKMLACRTPRRSFLSHHLETKQEQIKQISLKAEKQEF